MIEAIARRNEVKNHRLNEDLKFQSIIADFANNTSLNLRTYKGRLDELKEIKEEKEKRIDALNEKMKQMQEEYERQMEIRKATSNEIKNNMDSLSTFFSSQLTEIQSNLQNQIDKISTKWETNFTEHMEKYKDHVKKYDIFKEG
jgi:DNA anti-recombination protein RmuC